MAVADAETMDRVAMTESLWTKVRKLQEARQKAFAAYKSWIEEYPSRFGDRGCAEAAQIAEQLKLVIEVGKDIGLFGSDVKYEDYI